MLAGQAVMVNWSDVAEEDRAAYYAWHGPEHMVGRVGLPGFQRGRRFVAVHASRDILVLYEVDNIDVLKGAAYLAKANSPSPLTQRTTKLIRNTARALARYTREHAPGEEHESFAAAANATIWRTLDGAEIEPHKVQYYLERRNYLGFRGREIP